MTPYLISILTLVCLAAIPALALNLQWGLAGLVNFGLFGFYMLGAYVAALLTQAGWNPWAALAAAVAASAGLSALVSLVSIRLADDYLAIVTLGFAESLKLIAIHEDRWTRGSLGISGIARPVEGDGAFLAVAVAALAVVFILAQILTRSPVGRTARALRDDPVVTATAGKNVLGFRIRLFATGGAAIGLAGGLHAYYYQYIDPTQFGAIITAYAFMAVIIGGRGSHVGVLASAFTVVLLLEGTRYLDAYTTWLTSAQLAALRLMLIGAALIAVLIFRPQGMRQPYRLQRGPRT
ncbi:MULTISPECIES: branched-chain amino acid ABC transporter permease [Achromobacter]|uniref:branched-chain amino acid ABC transporter permease n=1 Tax=Achromobacter TaxID=222 RepID=UPI00046ABC7E|nr:MULTISPECIES: branched-chain amino acid ABC transporter permease [Achromobacter]CAB3926079.1 hypothetical protein LMG3412_05805 [Achromobacter deleyi]